MEPQRSPQHSSAVRAGGERAAINIGLLWHSASSGNLGVGALTLANMSIVDGVAAELGLEPRYTIIGMRDGEVPYLKPDQAEVFAVDTRSTLSPRGCWAVMGRQDCIFDIGGGDSFADIYGMKRFVFIWATKVIAVARGRLLLMSPQTIGPFTKTPYKQMAKFVLDRARTVIARDDISLRALEQLSPKARRLLSTDVAFALPYADRSAERDGSRLRIGVNVSGLLFKQAEAGLNRFGLGFDYSALTRAYLTRLAARDDVEIHLIAHVVTQSGPEDDGVVADQLHAEFPKAIRVPRFDGPSEAKSYISSLDFLVAARMHACIAAFSSGVPVAPIAYSRKFSGLFGLLDYTWMVPVSGMGMEAALTYLDERLAGRQQLAADEARGMSKVQGLLDVYRAELATVMSEAMARRR
jgi:colanic acid/amylovoran biosynthesis protein